MARAWITAEATTVKRTLINPPKILDDICLSIQEPLDPHSTQVAFHKKTAEIRHELQEYHRKAEEIQQELREFCAAGFGKLLQLHVPQKEQESKSCSTAANEKRPQEVFIA